MKLSNVLFALAVLSGYVGFAGLEADSFGKGFLLLGLALGLGMEAMSANNKEDNNSAKKETI